MLKGKQIQHFAHPNIRSDNTKLWTSRILVVAGRPFRSRINIVSSMAKAPPTVRD